MALDLRSLQKLQRDTGFNLDLLEKTYHITRILSGIFSNDVLSQNLALKGGTALNFIFLDIPRLSVDLDLNFIGAGEKEEMLAKRPRVMERICELARSMGYEISKKPGSYIMERMLLKYERLSGLTDSVRLEINYLERVPFVKIIRRFFRHPFEMETFDVNTYTIEEIAAMKLKAMAERLYARDIYDAYRIARMKTKNILLRKLMILYLLMTGKRAEIKTLAFMVERYDEREIIEALKPFMREGEERCLYPKEIKKTVGKFLLKMDRVDDSDQMFLKSLETGKLDLKILFGNFPFNAKANRHPSLLRALKIK